MPGSSSARAERARWCRPVQMTVAAGAAQADAGWRPRRRARARMRWSRIAADQQEEQQRDGGIEVDLLGCRACVWYRLMAVASVTPSEIGTSMLRRRARSACAAERKNGWPA